MKIIVTGGVGFIGSTLVRQLLQHGDTVLNIDCLTYAANQAAASEFERHDHYTLKKIDICDQDQVAAIIQDFQPHAIIHLAAESHVDRSIDSPRTFLQTNVMGTFTLLQCALHYWQTLDVDQKASFRFHHVSTDEVYGALGKDGLFQETTRYDPSSPYSASKAASDHFVRAWHRTYGLPTLVTNCSNNYGPGQFPEKLIPLMIIKGLKEQQLPVYGQGLNIRDWLHVEDHARALRLVLKHGVVGETYNIGGHAERSNIDIVHAVCDHLDQIQLPKTVMSRRELIVFTPDRPGHDFRYAIDTTKIKDQLGWQPHETFTTGLQKTIAWYLHNQPWWEDIMGGRYQGERLGQGIVS